MKNKPAKFIAEGALIAALYVILTFVSAIFGLSSGVIQLRLSEALCVLPIFTPAAIPGLFVGCIVANLLTGSMIADVIFGSLATLAAAVILYFMRKAPKILSPVPNIVLNTAVVPLILKYVYVVDDLLPFLFLTVGVGEIISSGVLGFLLALFLEKHRERLKL